MVSEKTRTEDDELREQLKHVDLEKLKQAIKPLVTSESAIEGTIKQEKKSG